MFLLYTLTKGKLRIFHCNLRNDLLHNKQYGSLSWSHQMGQTKFRHLLTSPFLVNTYLMNNEIFTIATERQNILIHTLQINWWGRTTRRSQGSNCEWQICKWNRLPVSQSEYWHPSLCPYNSIILIKHWNFS